MTTQASTQLGNPLALIIAGGIIVLLSLVQNAIFYFFDARNCTGLAGYFLSKNADKKIAEAANDASETIKENDVNKEELNWDDVDQVDLVGLDIGYGLIPLVNPETGGQLLPRIRELEKLSAELGFLVQPIEFETIWTSNQMSTT